MELTLREIADIIKGELEGDANLIIKGVDSLESAKPGDISFFNDKRYKDILPKTKASALIVKKKTALFNGPQILVANPALGFAKVAQIFSSPVFRYPGISEKALIGEDVIIGKDPSIFPFVYIGSNVRIGDNVTIFPGTFIGNNVSIGDNTLIYPNVTILDDTIIGKNVIIHAGTVIGSDGFGFEKDGARHIKIPQRGKVQIDDDVEIGANNCIDRATFGKTWIKKGVKTDNMVHIAHNVTVGENSIIVAQAGISGSVSIGNGVIIAGQVGIVDHIKIGDNAIIGPQSGIAKDIPASGVFSGSPAIPHRLFLKSSVLIPKLPEIKRKLINMEKKIKELEKKMEK